ncbi:expressed unknown protein [Seminavis robusta]|uniref:Uncharacterized protein n=1 Tax=Seminavis robusta TaxID=568900 RepID=A0A9N8HW49_9STRA|nr:expressed unknown protein [Seminavis robusta]|eukprot:Sro1599_g284970.1 n/a (155) ;mRNA; f:4244-4708
MTGSCKLAFWLFFGISAAAFSPKSHVPLNLLKTTTSLKQQKRQEASHHYPHKDFHRAIELAEDPDVVDIDEMLRLADELEKYDECFFENGDEAACEKEKMDREDLAGLLRLQTEVLLREDYLEKANLFKHDVEQARFEETWNDHQQTMDMYSNY